jgi:polar amino acid transport system substrate-binding protein
MPTQYRIPLIGALLLLTSFACAADASHTIRLRSDSWMPYTGQPADEQPGYVVEILRTVFEAKGYTIDYQIMPWDAAIKAAEVGEIEGVIGANQKEAQNLIVPKEAVGVSSIGLYTRKDNPWKYEGIPSLVGNKLGVSAGYSYWKELDAFIAKQGPEIVTFSGDAPLLDAIKQLDQGQLSLIVETQAVWLWNIKKSGRSNKDYRAAFVQIGEPIYVAFSPKAPAAYGQILSAGLEELRADGRLATILKKYYQSDWKH